MQYSIFSRLQGCLWGMVLGEEFGTHQSAFGSRRSAILSRQTEGGPFSDGSAGISIHQQPLSQISIRLLEMILQAGAWNTSVAERFDGNTWPNLSGGTLAIASLPITLLFHDDLNLQRQALWQLMDAVQASEDMGYGVVMYAYAIAQAVKGQLNPRLLIDQTQAYLRVTIPDSAPALPTLLDQLDQIQSLQASEADLTTALELLETQSPTTAPLAIALYCFLQAPHSFQLSLLQAAQVKKDYTSACALTAALLGAYNSAAAIPATWSTPELSFADVSSLDQLRQHTAQLFALWSGIYDASKMTEVMPPTVLAPWVLRLG